MITNTMKKRPKPGKTIKQHMEELAKQIITAKIGMVRKNSLQILLYKLGYTMKISKRDTMVVTIDRIGRKR